MVTRVATVAFEGIEARGLPPLGCCWRIRRVQAGCAMSRTKADWRVRANGWPASQAATRTRLRADAGAAPNRTGGRSLNSSSPGAPTSRGFLRPLRPLRSTPDLSRLSADGPADGIETD